MSMLTTSTLWEDAGLGLGRKDSWRSAWGDSETVAMPNGERDRLSEVRARRQSFILDCRERFQLPRDRQAGTGGARYFSGASGHAEWIDAGRGDARGCPRRAWLDLHPGSDQEERHRSERSGSADGHRHHIVAEPGSDAASAESGCAQPAAGERDGRYRPRRLAEID